MSHAALGMKALSDSLMAFTGFSRVWSPTVKIKNLRVDDNEITLKTNNVLKDVRWTPENLEEIKQKVSLWVLGNKDGNVTIFAGESNIDDLVTDCAKGELNEGKYKDLYKRHIALWPSHGLYYNRNRGEWIWQRATLWTTVEDLYSQEYVRLIRKMLENARATVYMPRAGLEHTEPGISGMPQWAEGARYWLQQKKVSPSIWSMFEGDEYREDMKCRATWINSLHTDIDLCLAFHTDGMDSGNDSSIIGTLVIYTAKDDDGHVELRDGRVREQENRNLGDWIQTQITEDLRHIAPEWTRRQLREANYCESRVPVVPSIILELLSHKNMADMKYGLDPQFRFAASRAVYKGILRYINGKSAVVQPLPVEQIAIDSCGTLKWEAQLDSLEPTATPTYYKVYVQENDSEWVAQKVEGETQCTIHLQRGVRYNFYVVAGNAGGLSFPSPKISAYLSPNDNDPMALIVDGFNDSYGVEWFADSTYAGIVPGSYACENYLSCAYIGQQWDFTRSSKWTDDDNCGWGSCHRDFAGQITVGNTHDYPVLHGRVLSRLPFSYVSCTEGMAPTFNFQAEDFTLVDIICGRQRKPIGDSLRTYLFDYIQQGGKVLMSTDHYSAIDTLLTKHYFHASYHASHATHNGRVCGVDRYRYRVLLEPNENQLFCGSPEGLLPEEGAVRMASYEDMRCPASIGYKHQTLVFGFPLEAVSEFDPVYQHAIEWLMDKETDKMAE